MDKTTMNIPQGVSFDSYESKELVCQNCLGRGLSIFYSVDSIPVHSCLLMSSREEALNYPRSNLVLGFCRVCGFVSNTCFDTAYHEYSTKYEETQGFSPTFNRFAESLAQKVIDDYKIHNKTVLEIGCGKGEFLALMCQLGKNKGIGIDPSFVPQRNPNTQGLDIEFIQEFYSDKHSHLQADVICCRHTLEHIAPTYEFMHTLRRTIGDKTNTLIFFELPDAMRVLQEGAFWDIYYEHCTYFTAGSLARLFRITGFDIDQLYLDYNGQYLIITAFPASAPVSATLEIEQDLNQVTNAFEQFGKTLAVKMDFWRQTIQKGRDEGQSFVIWGSGSKGVSFLTTLGLTDEIEYVVDINPYRHGKFMPGTGQEIVSPDRLTQINPDQVIVMNPIYCNEIQKDLDRLAVKATLIPV